MNPNSIPEDDAKAVLQYVEETGVFDELRQQLMSRLRSNEELERQASELILESKHLPLPTDDRKTKLAASEAIRRELTDKVLDDMVVEVWREMSDAQGQLHEDIWTTVHSALCKVYEEREKQKLAEQQTL